jgi:hypothetical protein
VCGPQRRNITRENIGYTNCASERARNQGGGSSGGAGAIHR